MGQNEFDSSKIWFWFLSLFDFLLFGFAQMIDDFADVNEGEKGIMKMWNLFMMKNKYDF